MAGAERRENLKTYTTPQLYDFKKETLNKLDEVKVDIERIRDDIIKMRDEVDALIKSKKNKQAAKRKINAELKRRRDERKKIN